MALEASMWVDEATLEPLTGKSRSLDYLGATLRSAELEHRLAAGREWRDLQLGALERSGKNHPLQVRVTLYRSLAPARLHVASEGTSLALGDP